MLQKVRLDDEKLLDFFKETTISELNNTTLSRIIEGYKSHVDESLNENNNPLEPHKWIIDKKIKIARTKDKNIKKSKENIKIYTYLLTLFPTLIQDFKDKSVTSKIYKDTFPKKMEDLKTETMEKIDEFIENVYKKLSQHGSEPEPEPEPVPDWP